MTKCYDSMYTIDSDTVQHQTLQEFDGVTQIGTPSFVHHQLADDQLRTPIPFRSSLIIGRKLLALTTTDRHNQIDQHSVVDTAHG